MRYRSRPSEIEAVQWTGDNLEAIESFGVKFRYGPYAPAVGAEALKIKAGQDGAQGYVPVPVGHWIVRQPGDLSDHHWPVDADYFAETLLLWPDGTATWETITNEYGATEYPSEGGA